MGRDGVMTNSKKKIPKKKKQLAANKSRNFNKTSSKKRQVQKKRTKGTKKQLKRKKIRPKKRKQSLRRILVELGAAVILAVVLLWLFSLLTFTFAKIDGYAMMPTLTENEVVFVNRLGAKKRFKLVYIRLPNQRGTSVRRIIGLPGEQIDYSEDRLYVNHQGKEEKFILAEIQEADQNGSFYTEDFTMDQQFKETTIPKGNYLVMGDNRPYSTDSRYYGFVDEKEIIGVVESRVVPLHKMERF